MTLWVPWTEEQLFISVFYSVSARDDLNRCRYTVAPAVLQTSTPIIIYIASRYKLNSAGQTILRSTWLSNFPKTRQGNRPCTLEIKTSKRKDTVTADLEIPPLQRQPVLSGYPHDPGGEHSPESVLLIQPQAAPGPRAPATGGGHAFLVTSLGLVCLQQSHRPVCLKSRVLGVDTEVHGFPESSKA